MRARASVFVMYSNGAWCPHGVLTEATLFRMKTFLRPLEGLFPGLSPNPPQTREAIAGALADINAERPVEWRAIAITAPCVMSGAS